VRNAPRRIALALFSACPPPRLGCLGGGHLDDEIGVLQERLSQQRGHTLPGACGSLGQNRTLAVREPDGDQIGALPVLAAGLTRGLVAGHRSTLVLAALVRVRCVNDITEGEAADAERDARPVVAADQAVKVKGLAAVRARDLWREVHVKVEVARGLIGRARDDCWFAHRGSLLFWEGVGGVGVGRGLKISGPQVQPLQRQRQPGQVARQMHWMS
jgi:hypothetical protein